MNQIFKFISKYLIEIIGAISFIILLVFPSYSIDVFVICIFLLVSVGFYALSSRPKYKLACRLAALYVLLNFIIFPIIYLIILKGKSDSFQFDNFILASEKDNSISEIKEYYNLEQINKDVILIDKLLKDSSKNLETKIEFLNQGNIVILNQYYLAKNCIPVTARRRPIYKATLNICGRNGMKLGELLNKRGGCVLSNSKNTIKNYLIDYLIESQNMLKEFNLEKRKITELNDPWTYRQLLPYSVNIFSTSNMVPKSKQANIVFFLHQLIVGTLIISLLIGIIQNLWTGPKK